MAIKKDDNPTIKLEQLRYPDIAFSNEVPAVPATTERDGNVTINNAAQPGSPAHFMSAVSIPITTTWNGVTMNSSIYLNLAVPAESARTQYREVCQRAVDQIAPLLRSLADQIEQELAEIDKAGLEKQAE